MDATTFKILQQAALVIDPISTAKYYTEKIVSMDAMVASLQRAIDTYKVKSKSAASQMKTYVPVPQTFNKRKYVNLPADHGSSAVPMLVPDDFIGSAIQLGTAPSTAESYRAGEITSWNLDAKPTVRGGAKKPAAKKPAAKKPAAKKPAAKKPAAKKPVAKK